MYRLDSAARARLDLDTGVRFVLRVMTLTLLLSNGYPGGILPIAQSSPPRSTSAISWIRYMVPVKL